MLRVRLPPEPSITPSWSSPECSPRCQRGGRGFESRRGRLQVRRHGTQTGKAARLKPGCLWVRLPPVLLATGFLGWCSSRRRVNPLPSSCEAEGGRFNSITSHWRLSIKVRSSIGRTSAPQAGEAGSIPARTTRSMTDSPGGGTGRRAGLRSTCPRGVGVRVSPRRLRLRVGRCSAEFHTLGGGGSTPRPATLGVHGTVR